MAAQNYTTAAAIKTHAAISDVNADTRLGGIATAVNEMFESYIGGPVGDAGTAVRTFDGDGSRLLYVRQGLQDAPTTVEVSSDKGTTYTTITDIELRPFSHDRPTGWPGFELYRRDGVFPAGWNSARITPNSGWGWAAIPPDLSQVALIAGLRMFQSSQSGEVLAIGTTDFGAAIVRFLPEPEYQAVLERYRTVISPSWVG